EEISDSKDELKASLEETSKALKEKEYQLELLNGLKADVDEMEAQKKTLAEEVKKSKKIINDSIEKIAIADEDLARRSKVVKDNEDKLLSDVNEHNIKVANFNKKFDQ